MNTPAIHAVSLLRFAPFLAESGIDPLEFFSRRGLAPNVFQLHDDWIPRDFCLDLSNALAADTGNPFAGAFLGNQVPILEFGELGRRFARAETVGTCCATAIRDLGLVHRGSRIAARTERDRSILRFSLEGAVGHDPSQFILATLAVLRNVILLADEPDMVKVRLSLPYELRCSEIEACLGGRLEFGCDHDEIEVRSEVLGKPICNGSRPSRTGLSLDATISVAILVSKTVPLHNVGIDSIAC